VVISFRKLAALRPRSDRSQGMTTFLQPDFAGFFECKNRNDNQGCRRLDSLCHLETHCTAGSKHRAPRAFAPIKKERQKENQVEGRKQKPQRPPGETLALSSRYLLYSGLENTARRAPSGLAPFRYFPVSTPCPRGDHGRRARL
jgi:hypothetical protein